MKELQVCNYNEFSLHILMINIMSDSLHDKLRAEKWLWLSLNHLIIYFKHYFIDSKTVT